MYRQVSRDLADGLVNLVSQALVLTFQVDHLNLHGRGAIGFQAVVLSAPRESIGPGCVPRFGVLLHPE